MTQYGMTHKELEAAFNLLGQQVMEDGTPLRKYFEDAPPLSFDPSIIETVKFVGEEVQVLYWFGNSNLYWSFTAEEWAEALK